MHAMRGLAEQAAINGDATLLIDFANAFITSDRTLTISLPARMCPELTSLTLRPYNMEPRLLTSIGDIVR